MNAYQQYALGLQFQRNKKMNWVEHIGKLLNRGTQDSLCGEGTPLLLS